MFENIGKKIKILAMVIAGCIVFVGVYFMLDLFEQRLYKAGFWALLISIAVSWLSTFTLYGFGEIIDKLTEIAENTRHLKNNEENKAVNNSPQKESCVSVQKKVDDDKPIQYVSNQSQKTQNVVQATANEKYCPICKVKIDNNRVFCPECGLDIKKRSELLGWD